MATLIRNVSDLPDWFDIRNYDNWEGQDPHEAVLAINNKFSTINIMHLISAGRDELSDNAIDDAMNELALSSKDPFRRHWADIIQTVIRNNNIKHHGIEYANMRDIEFLSTLQIEEATTKEAKRLVEDDISLPSEENRISRITLWDIMYWMDEHKHLLEEIERSAVRLSEENGWELDEVRSSLQGEIPIFDALDGTDFIRIESVSHTPEYVCMGIKEYLDSLPANQMDALPAKYSDVRKIFDYRIGAYIDLECWSILTGHKITKKCLAQAMFPTGRYGELDMQPTRTVGRFIERLRKGYIEDLTRKSAEMKTMQD